MGEVGCCIYVMKLFLFWLGRTISPVFDILFEKKLAFYSIVAFGLGDRGASYGSSFES